MCVISKEFDIFDEMVSDLLDVDQLADVHVIIAVADVGPYCLDHLSNHRDNDIPPGQRQRLTVEQLLQQRHHVAVVGWAEQEGNVRENA